MNFFRFRTPLSKIKPLAKIKRVLVIVALLFAVAAVSGIFLFATINEPGEESNSANSAKFSLLQSFGDGTKLAKLNTYNGLPVASVEEHAADNPKGTVILLPQYHLDPSTDIEDPSNDSAAKSQEEIYQVLKFLHENSQINGVALEGELFGQVDPQKLQPQKTLLGIKEELGTELDAARDIPASGGSGAETQNALVEFLNEELSSVDRELALDGAAQLLRTQNDSVQLFGVENAATQDECRDLVRNYVYLEDRMNQLGMVGGGENVNDNSTLSIASVQLKEMLKLMGQNKPLNTEFSAIKLDALLQGETEFTDLLSQVEGTLKKLEEFRSNKPASQAAPSPSRLDNPYQNITDRGELESKMQEAEKEIQDVVVEKRNEETAENAAALMDNNDFSKLALVFGAGHTEGLISELNKRGLSVITIKTDETARLQDIN